ncbi:MAG: hypothetical protein K2M20_03685 [Lachnospiraceae bacterium]|nr:hypothetical protein [Lachnospiraceae bacterium]
MEKKYYFRGLGLGIIVTAVIMGIALSGGGKKEKMTDDEVIARAKGLGMIEDSTLLDSSREENADDGQGEEALSMQEGNAAKKDIAAAGQKEEAEKKVNPQQEEKPVVDTPEPLQTEENRAAEAETPKEGDAAEPAGQNPAEKNASADTNEMKKQDEDVPEPEAETKPGTDGKTSVTIASGDGSYTVARKLAEAGLVSSADAYDDYLCANGYDKKLRPGTFEIPAQASGEQIARIVTGQE